MSPGGRLTSMIDQSQDNLSYVNVWPPGACFPSHARVKKAFLRKEKYGFESYRLSPWSMTGGTTQCQ